MPRQLQMYTYNIPNTATFHMTSGLKYVVVRFSVRECLLSIPYGSQSTLVVLYDCICMQEYISLMLKWRLDRGITSQINMLKKGFSEVYMHMYNVYAQCMYMYTCTYTLLGRKYIISWHSFAHLYTNVYVGQCGI